MILYDVADLPGFVKVPAEGCAYSNGFLIILDTNTHLLTCFLHHGGWRARADVPPDPLPEPPPEPLTGWGVVVVSDDVAVGRSVLVGTSVAVGLSMACRVISDMAVSTACVRMATVSGVGSCSAAKPHAERSTAAATSNHPIFFACKVIFSSNLPGFLSASRIVRGIVN